MAGPGSGVIGEDSVAGWQGDAVGSSGRCAAARRARRWVARMMEPGRQVERRGRWPRTGVPPERRATGWLDVADVDCPSGRARPCSFSGRLTSRGLTRADAFFVRGRGEERCAGLHERRWQGSWWDDGDARVAG